jgi:arsenite-transporting ATPase
MKELQALLKDPKTTEFVIVSIPTYLSLTESERLLGALRDQGIAVRRGVVNRMLSASDAEGTYLAQLSKGQAACLRELRELAERAAVDVTEVPYFDTECRAIYGLRALGAALLDAKSPTKPPVATGV